MHNDLVNPTNELAAIEPTPLARLARRLLVTASVVLAIGLAGVVSARSAEQRPEIVWVLPGHAIVLSAPAASEAQAEPGVVVIPSRPPVAEAAPVNIDQTPDDNGEEDTRGFVRDVDRDAAAQLAKADVSEDSAAEPLAKPQSAVAEAPLGGAKRVVLMEVTAYCPCTRCCGPQAQGITASGKRVSYNGGKFVAADRKLAFGTKITIPGYGEGKAVEVIDRGGAIKGDKLDVFFPTHQEALEWGRQRIPVIVER